MIHHGDLFDVLPTLAEASVDACVTDPPYGIGFMGREWDTFKPEVGQKRIVPNRQIDSENPNLKGRTRGPASSPSAVGYDYTVQGLRGFQEWTEQWAREVHRVLKPGAYLVVCGAPRSYHRMACGLEDAGFVIRDKFSWLFGQGFPKNYNLGAGKGTALKPAHEPIALAWKPFKGSIKVCHAAHGTAALNVDACRIEGPGWTKQNGESGNGFRTDKFMGGVGRGEPTQVNELRESNEAGRWPSNVLLDEEAAAMLDEQSGELTSGQKLIAHECNAPKLGKGAGYGGGAWSKPNVNDFPASRGGASRFFYVAKPSREERDMGCEGVPLSLTMRYSEQGQGPSDQQTPRKPVAQRNIHPTVKPVELMRWLVKLVTPLGGTVLDPFTGSGTTGMACAYELRPFIGIEREAEYVAIAKRRIAACVPLFGEQPCA